MGSKLSMPEQGLSPLVIALVWVLLVLTVLFSIWPVWRACLPLEIIRSEGFNAYHADTALSAPGLLYPPPDGLIANNYPPIYPFLIGSFAKLFGDAVYVGRVVSLLATLGLAVAAALIVRQFGGSRTAAIVSALWFVATIVRFYDDYVGINDPQLPAHLIMAVGLLWFISLYRADRSVEPAVLLMVIAGFVKNNVGAIPLAALAWLALNDWHKGLRATLFGFVATARGWAYVLSFGARISLAICFCRELMTWIGPYLPSGPRICGSMRWCCGLFGHGRNGRLRLHASQCFTLAHLSCSLCSKDQPVAPGNMRSSTCCSPLQSA